MSGRENRAGNKMVMSFLCGVDKPVDGDRKVNTQMRRFQVVITALKKTSVGWGLRAGNKLKSPDIGPSMGQRRACPGWSVVSRRGSEVNLSV